MGKPRCDREVATSSGRRIKQPRKKRFICRKRAEFKNKHVQTQQNLPHSQESKQATDSNVQTQFKLIKVSSAYQEPLIRSFSSTRKNRKYYLPKAQLKQQSPLFIQAIENKKATVNTFEKPKISQRVSNQDYFPQPLNNKQICRVCKNDNIKQPSYKEHIQSQKHKKIWGNSKKQSNLAQVLESISNQNDQTLNTQKRSRLKKKRVTIRRTTNPVKNKRNKSGVSQRRTMRSKVNK